MKRVQILSDYSPSSDPNVLTLIYDDQGDVHIGLFESQKREGVRIVASDTRHSERVRKAFYELICAYEAELQDEGCHPELRDKNGL